jgi:hypothetical protein
MGRRKKDERQENRFSERAGQRHDLTGYFGISGVGVQPLPTSIL